MPSPNGVSVSLGGKEVVLRLDMWALYKIELLTPTQTALHHVARAANGSIRSLAVLTWACLLHLDREYQVEDVVRMQGFGPHNDELLQAIAAEVEKNYPNAEDSGGKEVAAAEE